MRSLISMTTLVLFFLAPGALSSQAPDGGADMAQAMTSAPGVDGAESILERPAKLRLKDAPLAAALNRLQVTSGISVAYSPTLLPRNSRVTCQCEDVTVRSAIETLLEGTDFDFLVVSDQLVIRRRVVPQLDFGVREAMAMPELRVDMAALDLSEMSAPPAAQSVGILTGQVRDRRTTQPVASVQVYIQGLDVGVLTQQNGRFLLQDVPAGTHTVVAERIGYRSESAEVTIGDGETVVQNFQLAEEALQLDEVIVTGTPGGTLRRALGNSVGRLEADAVTERAPITNMDQLLTGRESGLTFHGANGIVGAGQTIRIRGLSSLAMSQQPLLYVDGIRVDNDPTVGPSLRSSAASKLNDFNPEDIESIEVIKGPAAATLYGTEASAGVIQIITKKGAEGAPQFDARIRQGANWLANAAWKVGDACMRLEEGETAPETPTGYMHPDFDSVFCHNLLEDEEAYGRPVLSTGHVQGYGLSVRGGTTSSRYYLSADWDDQTGMVDYNFDQRLSLRANVTLMPSDALTVDFSTGYSDGNQSFMQQVPRNGVWENLSWGNPATLGTRNRGFLRATPEAIAEGEGTREYTRFTGSSTITFEPVSWMTNRLVIGMDTGNDRYVTLVPRHPEGEDWFFGADALGYKDVDKPFTRSTTADFATSVRYGWNDDIGFTTSAGFQYYRTETEQLSSTGRIFPAPQITSIAGATNVETTESFDENASLGVYLQQEFSLRDRLFLTAAARADDNSAFGSDFDAAIYPKFSAAWVVSEEDFWQWDRYVNSLRLRSAWGQAGRQPSTFAAVTTFAPEVGPGGTSAIRPGVLGNPEVGPEVSQELEVGFEAALLDDRLSVDFTYYTQKVEDALMNIPVASSSGFSGAQSVNLAEMDNWGWELSLDGRVLERDAYALDLGFGWSHNDNVVRDLGGEEGVTVSGAHARVGYRYPAAFWVEPVQATFNEDGVVESEDLLCDAGTNLSSDGLFGDIGGDATVPCTQAPRLYHGPASVPRNEATGSATLTILDNLQLSALVEWRGEANVMASQNGCQFSCYPRPALAVDPYGADEPIVSALAVGYLMGGNGRSAVLNYNSSFAKLRELSANYTLPTFLAERIGASRATVNLAARNLWTIWAATEYVPNNDPRGSPLPDPENRSSGELSVNQGNPAVPPLTSLMMTVRVSF